MSNFKKFGGLPVQKSPDEFRALIHTIDISCFP